MMMFRPGGMWPRRRGGTEARDLILLVEQNAHQALHVALASLGSQATRIAATQPKRRKS